MKSKPAPKSDPSSPAKSLPPELELRACSDRHLRFGWWSLLVFLTVGMVLEGLHGFKVGWYLNASNETRRLMWTLAHAHGTLVALVQIVFGLTVRSLPGWKTRQRALAGALLVAANVLLPGGFLLGGLFLYGGDPGVGVLLVPVGAVLLFTSVFLTARSVTIAA